MKTQELEKSQSIAGRYWITAPIAKSTRAHVFEAVDELDCCSPCVIKLIQKNESDPHAGSLFAEASRMMRCYHPGLARLTDFGFDSNHACAYVVMENAGRLLNDLLPMDIKTTLETAERIVSAMDYVHRLGYLMSDLEPRHILVNRSKMKSPGISALKLINYGVSLSSTSGNLVRNKRMHTIAPELIRGDAFDARIDLYALGVILFYLLKGVYPFEGTIGQILKQHVENPPPLTGLDSQIDQLIIKLMAKIPDNRFDSAAAVKEEITGILAARFKWRTTGPLLTGYESRFVGRSQEMRELTAFIDDSRKPSYHAIILTGEKGIGKHRFEREFLAEIRLKNIGVIENLHSPVNWNRIVEMVTDRPVIVPIDKDSRTGWLNWISTTKVHPRSQPVFWVFTLHSDEDQDYKFREAIYAVLQSIFDLRLLPLDTAESVEILSCFLHKSEQLMEIQPYVDQMSGGNPLFIRETLQFLIDTGSLDMQFGRWSYIPDRIPRFKYPPLILDILQEKIQGLSKNARKYLETFSLLSRPVVQSDYEQLFDPYHPEVIMELFDNGLFQRQMYNDVAILDYSHPAVQHLVSKSIPKERAARKHAIIAQRMSELKYASEQVIYHRIRSNQRFSLMDEAIQAAWNALIKGRISRIDDWVNYNADNIRYSDKLRLLVVRSYLFLYRNKFKDALHSIHQVTSKLRYLKPHPFDLAAYYWIMSYIAFQKGAYTQALSCVRNGMKIARDVSSFMQSIYWIIMGRILCYRSQPRKAAACIIKAQKYAALIPDNAHRATAYVWIFDLQACISIDQGLAVEDHLKDVKRYTEGEFNGHHQVLINLRMSEACAESGTIDEAKNYANKAFEISNQIGMKLHLPEIYNVLGLLALRESEYSQADAFFDKGLACISSDTHLMVYTKLVHNRATLFYLGGDLKQSETMFLDLLSLGRQHNLKGIILESLTMLGFTLMDASRYEESMEFFEQARAFVMQNRSLLNKKNNDKMLFGTGLLHWILNQRSKAKIFLKKSLLSTAYSKNDYIRGRVFLTLSQILRLERNHARSREELEKSRKIMERSRSIHGMLLTRLNQLRKTIDHDLSAPVWSEAVRLWDEIRVQNEVRIKIEAGLVIAKLAVRRNDLVNALKIIDLVIGISTTWGFREFNWRALRLKAQIFDSWELFHLAEQSLKEAQEIIQAIVDDIRSDTLKASYRLRPDVEAIRRAMEEIRELRQGTYRHPKDIRISQNQSNGDIQAVSGTLGESFRLYRNTMQRVRSSIYLDTIVNIILESLLKITGSERGAIFLMDEMNSLQITASKSIGASWTMDLQELKSSRLVHQVISNKVIMYSSNIMADERFASEPVVRKVGMRSILMTPMVVQDRVIGLFYVDSRLGNAEYLAMHGNLIQELANESALSIENARLYSDMNEMLRGVIRLLASVVDAKDSYTAGHSSRVAIYAVRIGEELGYKESTLRDLELAALLHDIGKIGIAQDILDNPNSLNPDERKAISCHPEIGANILAPMKKFIRVWKAILQHHERFDGSGYPLGLKGEEIDDMARILAVADALDAMTTDRPYRKAVSLKEAMDQIRAHSGHQFDPEITGIVDRLIEKKALDIT